MSIAALMKKRPLGSVAALTAPPSKAPAVAAGRAAPQGAVNRSGTGVGASAAPAPVPGAGVKTKIPDPGPNSQPIQETNPLGHDAYGNPVRPQAPALRPPAPLQPQGRARPQMPQAQAGRAVASSAPFAAATQTPQANPFGPMPGQQQAAPLAPAAQPPDANQAAMKPQALQAGPYNSQDPNHDLNPFTGDKPWQGAVDATQNAAESAAGAAGNQFQKTLEGILQMLFGGGGGGGGAGGATSNNQNNPPAFGGFGNDPAHMGGMGGTRGGHGDPFPGASSIFGGAMGGDSRINPGLSRGGAPVTDFNGGGQVGGASGFMPAPKPGVFGQNMSAGGAGTSGLGVQQGQAPRAGGLGQAQAQQGVGASNWNNPNPQANSGGGIGGFLSGPADFMSSVDIDRLKKYVGSYNDLNRGALDELSGSEADWNQAGQTGLYSQQGAREQGQRAIDRGQQQALMEINSRRARGGQTGTGAETGVYNSGIRANQDLESGLQSQLYGQEANRLGQLSNIRSQIANTLTHGSDADMQNLMDSFTSNKELFGAVMSMIPELADALIPG